jgi:hypothetical protein
VGPNPTSLAIGEMNGDSTLDIAVAKDGSNNVTILLGDGSGGFSQTAGSPIPVGTSPTSIAAADFNGDGKRDLAVANGGSNNVTILLGSGAGGFGAIGVPVPVGPLPTFVMARDLNGDGKVDLVVANNGASHVTVLLGNGAGAFSEAAGSPVPVGTGPNSIAAGEFNGDSAVDLAVANLFANNATILLKRPWRRPTAPRAATATPVPSAMRARAGCARAARR